MQTISRRDLVRTSVAASATAMVAGPSLASQGAETPGEKGGCKIIAVCCSPRQGKTTAASLKVCLEAAIGLEDAVRKLGQAVAMDTHRETSLQDPR